MITPTKLKHVVRQALPASLATAAEIKLDSASPGGAKHLRVVTAAWENDSRLKRISRIVKALHCQVAAQERQHIISVAVFTPAEWEDRKRFAESITKPTARKARKPAREHRSEIKVLPASAKRLGA